MQRFATQKLLEWKVSTNRKPLIIEGARQVGKTWLMQEFGKNHYNNSIYINFDRNSKIHSRFDIDLDPKRIIRDLSIHFETDITSETLIIFDEIQECKNALRSLKYFCEETPEYHIVAAGSLLGVALHEGDSFPVGKVDFLKMYPLSFYEFLSAIGKNKLLELLQSKDIESITSFKEELTELLRTYYFVGGMPASINSYISNGTYTKSEEVDGCKLTFDVQGRITAISFPEYDSSGNVVAYRDVELTAKTVTDEAAYQDAYNQYEYKQYEYDKAQQDINRKTEIIQQEDRNLELKLQRLDNERTQITTEIEAVEKVIQENIESSYKTFSG